MIRFSREQMLALENTSMHRFISRVVDELPGYRGPVVAGRSRTTLFQAATTAVEHGQSFDLESERALFLFSNIAVSLGAYFFTDPALPWARDIVNDASYLTNEMIDDLWNAYTEYCEYVMGPEADAIFPEPAYARFLALPPPPPDDGTFAPVIADMAALWPEKVSHLAPDALREHILGAGKRAAALGIKDHGARVWFCRIAFLNGQSFDADPIHDWALPALQNRQRLPDTDVASALRTSFIENVIQPALAWQSEPETPEAPDNDNNGDT